MNLFILRWNPAISSYKTENHLEIINHIKNEQQPRDFNWSIREYKKLKKDDMFILQQVGTDHDGIAMIGKFKDKCYEDDSWRKDGSKLYYADMWIMDAFDCDGENPLPARRYEELFPEIEWHGGHSGILIEEDLDDRIVDKIEEDLIKAGIWKEGELNKFLTYDFEKDYSDGKFLLQAKNKYLENPDKENFVNFISNLLDAEVLIPMHVEKDENGDDKYYPIVIKNDSGQTAIPIFSTEEQLCGKYQEDNLEIYGISILICIEILEGDGLCNALVLDPFTNEFMIDQELADLISELPSK